MRCGETKLIGFSQPFRLQIGHCPAAWLPGTCHRTAVVSPSNLLCPTTQLVNYPDWRHHEVLALWQWLGRSGRQLEVIGMLGPLAGRADAVELHPQGDLGGFRQSTAFIVV